jgi:hypothetical protein
LERREVRAEIPAAGVRRIGAKMIRWMVIADEVVN